MSVMETVLIFVVVPAAGLALLALLVFGPGLTRSPRYRPGRPWDHEPVWYVTRPDSVDPVASEGGRAALTGGATTGRALTAGSGTPERAPASVLDVPTGTARGGASGEW